MSDYTIAANAGMSTTHDRMPVILQKENFLRWFNTRTGQEALLTVLVSWPNEMPEAYPVSNKVNEPKHNEGRGGVMRVI